MISLLKNLCWKVCIYVNVFWCTLVWENVCAGSGAVFCRKMRGMSLWSHSWTKWLPFREASYVSSPLFATIPTWWLKIDEKNKITFHSKGKLDFCMFSRKHNCRLPMQNNSANKFWMVIKLWFSEQVTMQYPGSSGWFLTDWSRKSFYDILAPRYG